MRWGQDLVKNSIKSTEEAARQIIVGTSILVGLYFHAITYSDIRGSLTWWQVAIYFLPIALWLASLWFTLSIFFPRRYTTNISSSEISKQTYEEIVDYKLKCLRVATIFLGLGILGLSLPLTLYLVN